MGVRITGVQPALLAAVERGGLAFFIAWLGEAERQAWKAYSSTSPASLPSQLYGSAPKDSDSNLINIVAIASTY